MPTIRVEKDKCKGCELCVQFCPKKVLKMSDDINAKGYHYSVLFDEANCIGCATCGLVCPDVCITVYK